MRRIIGFVTMFFLAVTVVFGKSQENVIDITFNKLGAVYHKNESGNAVCKVIKANNDITYEVVVEIVDIDKKPIGYKKTYTLSSPFERYYYVPFQFSELGYYYLSVSFLHGDKVIFSKQEGFGVIPDVTLTKKDYDSPFGVGAHYARYGDWRVAEIQQALGIAWVRDVARWKDFIGTARNTPDPFIDYLDRHNICWLPILDYVDANHGWRDENGIWRWDEDVTNIKKYVEMNENRILVYESQNEPSNFAGWNKRWPHPQGQKWRPQGWGVPFTDLVKQMHDSIKAVNGDIKLIWPGEEEWIQYFDDNREDVANHIDFTAIHPYILWRKYPETSPFYDGFYKIQKEMLKKRNIPTEIWVTETGWTTYLPDSIRRHFPPVTEYQQAQYLVRNYLVQLYFGAGKMFWYELVEEPFGVHHPESGFGILRYNTMLTVKPAAVAFANMVNNYRYLKPIGKYLAKDRKTYGFIYENEKESGAPVLSIWREADEKEELIPVKYTKSLTGVDIFGRTIEIPIIDGMAHLPLSMSVLTVSGFDMDDLKNLYEPKEQY